MNLAILRIHEQIGPVQTRERKSGSKIETQFFIDFRKIAPAIEHRLVLCTCIVDREKDLCAKSEILLLVEQFPVSIVPRVQLPDFVTDLEWEPGCGSSKLRFGQTGIQVFRAKASLNVD